ncbi:hypothetical protein OH492_14315 [Vibrio chagasii]|nr:hypothetical protein [Vibrio chagasii]
MVPTAIDEQSSLHTKLVPMERVHNKTLENHIDHVTPEDISADHSMSGLARTKLVKDSILSKADYYRARRRLLASLKATTSHSPSQNLLIR